MDAVEEEEHCGRDKKSGKDPKYTFSFILNIFITIHTIVFNMNIVFFCVIDIFWKLCLKKAELCFRDFAL